MQLNKSYGKLFQVPIAMLMNITLQGNDTLLICNLLHMFWRICCPHHQGSWRKLSWWWRHKSPL